MRVAVVTGGSRGIGRSVCVALARTGVAVAVVGRDAERARETAAFLDREAPRSEGMHMAIPADVAQPEACARVAALAHDTLGPVDILVNAAGICRDSLLARSAVEEVQETLDINLAGPLFMCRAVAKPMMRQRGGVIVNIGSIIGEKGHAGQVAYSTSKAGLTGLTLSLAHELGPRGIRVNQVSPGFIDTDMTADLPAERRAEILQKIPLGTFGQAEDVAELVSFLVSPAARYITGQVVGIDGGLRI